MLPEVSHFLPQSLHTEDDITKQMNKHNNKNRLIEIEIKLMMPEVMGAGGWVKKVEGIIVNNIIL